MDEERKLEFAEDFGVYKPLVELAYEKIIHQKFADFGYRGAELKASREITLFNVLGAISGETDIWSVMIRGNLAVELCEKFDPLNDYTENFNYEDIKELADEISKEWSEMITGNAKEIESDIKKHGLGYAPYRGMYDNWKEAGHTCPFEYCIKTFPLNTDCKISCQIFGHDCPGEVKIND